MVRAILSSKNKRERDRGRVLLQIGRGASRRYYHLSDAETEQLMEDLTHIRAQRK